MITLEGTSLTTRYPEIHADAELAISFQRTLRLPDDGRTWPLPPGLGEFPVETVDENSPRVPQPWLKRGGLMLPMHQSEAMWIQFESRYIAAHGTRYPFAIKVAAGKVNAITGDPWVRRLFPAPQDYLVTPPQRWLDGFCVERGVVRQFVAVRLGAGATAEEQAFGDAEFGGIQILVAPMYRAEFDQRFPRLPPSRPIREGELPSGEAPQFAVSRRGAGNEMGFGAGARIRQELHADPFGIRTWDVLRAHACFVHMVHAYDWARLTGSAPPQPPPRAEHYAALGLPWFDDYENAANTLLGSGWLAALKPVAPVKRITPADALRLLRVVDIRRAPPQALRDMGASP